ncbi:MAG: tetratricopeptide repeat protein [Burkholderiales bacterium]|nr:tetratricopeptide repeat protein [Burkholderiales bacterium]MDE2431370.1 tetratricopeptide repeat protein [Burkholderiales bacterium]
MKTDLPNLPIKQLAWLSAALLTGGAVATVATLRWMSVYEAPSRNSIVATATLPIHVKPAPAVVRPQRVADARSMDRGWQLDWHLSLSRLTPHSDEPAEVMAKAPPVVQDAQTTTVAQLNDRQVILIEAPAAGRTLSPAKQAVESYRHALDLQDQGRQAAALEAALGALQFDPTHVPARRLAVSLALDLGNTAQADQLIAAGLKVDPQDPELLYLQARSLAMGGANEQALAVLDTLPHLRSEALGLKAGVLAKLGRFAPAAMAYEQALKTHPDNATWWLGLGVAWRAQGQVQGARQAFTRAHALGQLSPDVQAWIEQQL